MPRLPDGFPFPHEAANLLYQEVRGLLFSQICAMMRPHLNKEVLL